MKSSPKKLSILGILLLQCCMTPRKPVDPCVEAGNSYNVGDKIKRDCNECICQKKGGWLCTLMGCDEKPEK